MTEKIKNPEGDDDAFTRDMALAQAEMENAAYNRVNPHFKSKYADYAAVREAIRPAYKYGFRTNFVFRFEYTPAGEPITILRLIVQHKSGKEEISERPIRGETEQQQGSSMSYGRRYLLGSYFNIASEDDDDGNVAETAGRQRLAAKPKIDDTVALIDEMRQQVTRAGLKEWGLTNRARINAMPDSWQREFRSEYERTMHGIAEDEAALLGEPEKE